GDGGLGDLGRAVGVGEALAEVDRPGLDGERRHLGEDRRAEALQARGQVRGAARHADQNLLTRSGVAAMWPVIAAIRYAIAISAWAKRTVRSPSTEKSGKRAKPA